MKKLELLELCEKYEEYIQDLEERLANNISNKIIINNNLETKMAEYLVKRIMVVADPMRKMLYVNELNRLNDENKIT